MALISDILNGIRLATDLLTKQDPRRERVGELLEKIASTIDQVLSEYRSGQMGTASLSELAVYCEHFKEATAGILTQETVIRIDRLLAFAYCTDSKGYKSLAAKAISGNGIIVESVSRTFNLEIGESQLAQVEETAGKLRAMATLMRASSAKL